MVNPKKYIEQWGPIDAVLLYPSFWFPSFSGSTYKKWRVRWPDMIGVFRQNQTTFYWNKEDMQERAEQAIDTWLFPEANFQKLHTDYRRLCSKLLSLSKAIAKAKTGSGEKKLKQLAGQWYNTYTEFWDNTSVFEIANFGAPDLLRKKITAHVPKDKIDTVLEILLAPESLSFHEQSELELYKTYYASPSKKILLQKLKKYEKRWYWVNSSYFESTHADAAHFFQQLNSVTKAQARKKIDFLDKHRQKIRASKFAAAKKYRLPRGLIKTARRLAYSIWWQDDRKAKVWWANSVIHSTNEAASRVLGVPADELLWYSAEEWRRAWTKKYQVAKEAIEARRNFCVCELGENSIKVHTGEKARTVAAPFMPKAVMSPKKQKTLHGIVVSKGKGNVQGTVRIVRSPRGEVHFNPGDILVSPMTSPDYVPIMRKAAAVVTDVGGLMSHAAVVSRELGIPCITGTKFATSIFKNGDTIHVDVKNGKVKKL